MDAGRTDSDPSIYEISPTKYVSPSKLKILGREGRPWVVSTPSKNRKKTFRSTQRSEARAGTSSFSQSVRVDLLARSMLQSVGESTACRETPGPPAEARDECSRLWHVGVDRAASSSHNTDKVSVLDLFGLKSLSLNTGFGRLRRRGGV